MSDRIIQLGRIQFDFDEATKAHFLRAVPTPYEEIRRRLVETIENDREGKIRQALIELGWTPPKD